MIGAVYPLSYRDVEAMLIRLGDSTSGIVRVGGQAVSFWTEQHLPRARELSYPARACGRKGGRSSRTRPRPKPTRSYLLWPWR